MASFTYFKGADCDQHPYGCTAEDCDLTHHENLFPSLAVDNLKDGGYMVNNDINVACLRCLEQALPCDKKTKERGGSDDPCSECRHFGGVLCECELSESSYNDALWAVMLARGRDDFTLPTFKPRDQPRGPRRKKGPPLPMRDDRVKVDWDGDSREQLLAKVDMLPDGVRQLPRKHVVPPRETDWQQKFQLKKHVEESEINGFAHPDTVGGAYFQSDEEDE